MSNSCETKCVETFDGEIILLDSTTDRCNEIVRLNSYFVF